MSDLPYLAEHEGISEPTGLAEPEISPEEKKAAKLVDTLFSKYKKHREKYDRNWAWYYRYFRGDQWKKKRASYRHSEVINLIFQTIQSQVPIMTDSRPRPSFVPTDPSDIEFSVVLNEVFEADWQAQGWLYKITEVIYDGHIYGTGFSNLYFDKDALHGLGRIGLQCEDPFFCYPCNTARSTNDRCDGFIHAEPTDVSELKARYAGHKYVSFIKADMSEVLDRSLEREEGPKRNYNLEMPDDSYSGEKYTDEKQALVTTLYLKPKDTEEIETEKEDEATGEIKKEYVTKLKYPRGRKIVKINKYIFEDGPLDNDDLSIPYSKYSNYMLPREFFGISEVEQLQGPQDIFNKLVNFTLDVLTLMGNPIWLIPTASGVKPKSFHNAPGMQIPYDGAEPPRRVEGTQLQPYVMQLIDRMENWFNSLSGSQDITRGVNPAGVTAARAIEGLQDAAQTRIRQKMRNLDDYMVCWGRQYVQLALQNYSVPRIFRLTNKEGIDKFFRYHVEIREDEYGEEERVGVVTNFEEEETFDDAGKVTGKRSVEKDTKEYVLRGDFDVKVNTQSGLPFNKAEKEQRLLQLYDRQVIDREELLKQIEYPNYEGVLKRMNELERQAAEAQQQQEQRG